MALIDTGKLPVVEKKPGWHGRYFDSLHMTFGHYTFDEGAAIHAHAHEQEEIWQVLEGELEITIAGVAHRAGAGFVGIVPPNTEHAVKALTKGRAIVVDSPRRDGFASKP
jgi:quercetin dioxygenase-like cupin family protein